MASLFSRGDILVKSRVDYKGYSETKRKGDFTMSAAMEYLLARVVVSIFAIIHVSGIIAEKKETRRVRFEKEVLWQS